MILSQNKIRFWGDLALFTRPEFKSEPHTYEVPTPTAVNGMLESIFWKPEFRYKILSITVLNPIEFLSIHRNMVNSKQSFQVAKKWMNNNGVGRYFTNEDRAQRNHTILKNVDYVIDFDIELMPHTDAPPTKYWEQLEKRVSRGQCYKQPYFGCREYAAYFDWATGFEIPHPDLSGAYNLGMMPFTLHYIPDPKGVISWRDKASQSLVRGKVVTEFFPAIMVDGVIKVEAKSWSCQPEDDNA